MLGCLLKSIAVLTCLNWEILDPVVITDIPYETGVFQLTIGIPGLFSNYTNQILHIPPDSGKSGWYHILGKLIPAF